MIICTICARGGSKGVPGKNVRPIAGKPLIAHSIDQAKSSGLFAAVAVSSDSEEILEVALACGADLVIRRPDEMASDQASKLPAIRHAAAATEERLGQHFDILVDLDCTSPLRLPQDIADAVAFLESSGATCVITGAKAHRSPYFNLVEITPDGGVAVSKSLPGGIVRRQDAPRCFDMNASIYVWRREPFMSQPFVFGPTTRLWEMPAERSFDIDDPLDWDIVDYLMTRRQK